MHIVIKDSFYTALDILHPIVRFNGHGHLSTLQLIPPVNTIVPPLTKCSVLMLIPLIVRFVHFTLHLSDSVTFNRCSVCWLVLKSCTFILYSVVCLCSKKSAMKGNIFGMPSCLHMRSFELSSCSYTGCVFLLLKHKI